MMNSKFVYKSLIVLINIIACFFLGLIYIGSFSTSEEAANPLTNLQILIRIIIYGFGVSLFFSIITFLISIFFRKKLSFNWKYLISLFFIQFILQIVVYIVISLFMYLK